MKARQIHEQGGQRTFVAILDPGDEVMACLQRLCEQESISAAQISAIGAFSEATLAFWDTEKKTYLEHPVAEQTEVLSLLGDVSEEPTGKPRLHLHAVLGRRDASTLGGHLLSGKVRPTLEVILTESPAHLRRVHDESLGLAVIRL